MEASDTGDLFFRIGDLVRVDRLLELVEFFLRPTCRAKKVPDNHVGQFVAVSVLTPFGLSRTDAIAYILFYQAVSYVVVLSWGLIALGQQRAAFVTK